jgi:hypothetical protein
VFDDEVVGAIVGSLRDETKGQEPQDFYTIEDSVWVIKIIKMT